MANGTYTFQTVTVPGASDGTWLGGINNSGEVTGYDSGFGADHYPHAFTYANSTFTPISLPTSRPNQTTGNGINNQGQVVGADGTPPIGVVGFLWSPDGSYQEISSIPGVPPPDRIDIAYGINDNGQVVGADFVGRHVGFIWQGGAMSFLQVPGASTTEAHGINNSGVIVGTADNYGFIDFGGQISLMGIPGATVVDARAINNDDTVVGSYNDGTHWHGWIDQGGSLTFINAPGATDTWVTGINDAGTIVGYDSVDGGAPQGFIATDPPAADPITTMVREDYVGLFGRDADPGAQSFWTNLLKTTAMTPRDFVWALTNSAEGQWLHGQQTDAQFVNSIYVNALGRQADAGAQAVWSGVLHSGAGRWDVLAAIAGSAEGQQHFALSHT